MRNWERVRNATMSSFGRCVNACSGALRSVLSVSTFVTTCSRAGFGLMEQHDLARAAGGLSSILGDICLLIGGLAVSAWGHVRATEDIDFVSSLEPEALQELLAMHAIPTELKRGDDPRSG